jgi:hypothetical protein
MLVFLIIAAFVRSGLMKGDPKDPPLSSAKRWVPKPSFFNSSHCSGVNFKGDFSLKSSTAQSRSALRSSSFGFSSIETAIPT